MSYICRQEVVLNKGMASTAKQLETEEVDVTVSRSGRVCKKSTKLMYLDTTNAAMNKKKRKKHSKRHQKSKQFENNVGGSDTENNFQIVQESYAIEKSQKINTVQQDQVSQVYEPTAKIVKADSSSEIPSNPETESDSSRSKNEVQTPDYTSLDDDSLNSDEELLSAKVKAPDLEKDFAENVVENRSTIDTQNSTLTGYKLWSNEMKTEIFKKYPKIDLNVMTIRLGEMWTKMSIPDKNNWHTRAQQLNEKAELFSNKSVIDYDKKDWINACNPRRVRAYQIRESKHEVKLRSIELQPIDVAAHLKLLGESLMLIGARLIHHDKPVIISDCITVLLDSLLCAMGSLICLSQEIPNIRRHDPMTLLKTLENIAYIMPGL